MISRFLERAVAMMIRVLDTTRTGKKK